MDFHLHSASPSSSASSTSTHHPPNNNNNSDPIHSWWESISKARSHIHLLSSLLPSIDLLPLADTDRPARSLLLSSPAYSSLSAALSSPSSGSSDDPLCHWLYDTYLSSDPDLRLVVLSHVPILAANYLRRTHHLVSPTPASLSGFEAVLLALYSSETKARNGRPVVISIPDLSQPSLYHAPRNPPPSSTKPALVGVLSPALEPQIAVKSTKRACIVGVALDCYYKQVSQMPRWSKVDFCKFVAVWAGKDCPCTSDYDQDLSVDGIVAVDYREIGDVVERVKDLDIEDEDSGRDFRIPLPWELLQPVLRILGHCLLGPLNGDEVKDAASVAARRLYARASHDLVPHAILATRSLIQLDKRAREAVKSVDVAASSAPGSNANTPSKAKKPEILLVSK